MVKTKKKLGEILYEAGIINDMQQNLAAGQQSRWGGKFGSVLIQMGFVNEETVATILEKQYNQKCINIKNKEIPLNALSMVKPDVAKKFGIMPLAFDKRTLTIATSEPNNLETIDDLAFMLSVNIKPLLAVEYDIKKAIKQYYS